MGVLYVGTLNKLVGVVGQAVEGNNAALYVQAVAMLRSFAEMGIEKSITVLFDDAAIQKGMLTADGAQPVLADIAAHFNFEADVILAESR